MRSPCLYPQCGGADASSGLWGVVTWGTALEPRPKTAEAGGCRLLLSPSQDKLVWVGGESLGHPEGAGTEAKARLLIGTEPGKELSVHEEIGIPEVQVNQGIKVNMETRGILGLRGQREIERILGRRQGRQLRHERRERGHH
jgi:hypothetical protein